MDMPEVTACEVTSCAYNRKNECHALAITVGDPGSQKCDTFWDSDMEGGDEMQKGHVGACHMSNCMYNQKLECQIDSGITVGMKGKDPECMTFKSQ